MLDDDLGRHVVTLPFSDQCDPVVASPGDWSALSGAVQAFGLPWSVRSLDTASLFVDDAWTATRRARWHRLDVDRATEDVWSGAAGAFRRGVRKAGDHAVAVRPLEGTAGVGSYAALHRSLRRSKHGLLAQPTAFFKALRDNFAPLDAWYPVGAFHDDQLVAATIYLRRGDTLFYKFNASVPDALSLRPNNALIWAGVELAHELGCRTLDLGPSDDVQPGLIRFKAQTGATAHQLTVHRWTPPGSTSEPDETRRLRATLEDLTALFVAPEVGLDVVELAGDALYPSFA